METICVSWAQQIVPKGDPVRIATPILRYADEYHLRLVPRPVIFWLVS